MANEEADEAPKHPYVTAANAKIHLIFSLILIVLSTIQLIVGIVMSEALVRYYRNVSQRSSSYYSRETNYMMGDGVWIAMIGYFNGLMGLSVWKTRSRSNGVLHTVFLFLSFFCAYTTACGLSILKPDEEGVRAIGIVSSIVTGITGIITLIYAFYTSFHACCNSKVRKERRVLVPPGMTLQQPTAQPQMVYVPQQQQQQQVYLPNQMQQHGYNMNQPPQYIAQPYPQPDPHRPDLPPSYTEKAPIPE